MSLFALILKELRHHWLNSSLVFAGLAVAVALLTAARLTTTAAERETRRVMRDLGFNLRIVPRDTDLDAFWERGYSDKTMPADTVQKMAAQQGLFISFNHLTPSLEQRFPVGGRDVLLTGIGSSVIGPGEKKQPMGFVIAKGTVYLGSSIATRLGAQPRGTIDLAGRTFTVEKVLAESGTPDDIRIFTALEDAQALLGLPGRINEIKAVDCLCLTADQDPLKKLRQVLEKALPEAQVIQMRTLADARAKQRQMSERLAAIAVPGVLIGGALWVGLLMVLNVRERRAEIGLWRALGRGSGVIAGLFLGKAAFLGAAGALAGYGAGTALALKYGPGIFRVTAGSLAADPLLLWQALAWTPLFAALVAFLPAMIAVAHDPAETLRTD